MLMLILILMLILDLTLFLASSCFKDYIHFKDPLLSEQSRRMVEIKSGTW